MTEDYSPADRARLSRLGQPDDRDRHGRLRTAQSFRSFRYSRFVGLAKLILPLTAGALILALVAWPYLSSGLGRDRGAFPKLDSSAVQDVRMLHPHYNGVDRQKRPFTIIAENARQVPHNDALLALEQPKANLQGKDGGWTVVTGQTGMYQPEAHDLDLFGKVTLFHDRGYTFITKSARVDLGTGLAEGSEAIVGSGPSGAITGEGFRILHGGDSVLFTGKSHLTMIAAQNGTRG